ncbi:hypothetical protein [Methylosinus sporium]|uniref:Holliday junction resolvase RuvC n=1 Tax=Methylosinus sporium TaxID=428 RepID=A0A2U1SSV8_METSR|nr:hypothetical protein [Methylosinus sporium]PWB94697.1 hypothetical protein C5689_06430 [Methylosinus sporium]
MKILGLDLARKCGVGYGDESERTPRSFSFELYSEGRSEGYYDGAGKLGSWLNDWITANVVDAIVCERFLDPSAQENQAAIISGLLYQGAVLGVARCYDIPVYLYPVASARIHLCGRATAHPPRRGGAPRLSKREVAQRREDTKRMVWKQCVMLGLIPSDAIPDYDRSDGVCMWEYGVAKLTRATRPLALSNPAW